MRFRNTLVIAVLFLALAAWLYFVESEKIREEAEGEKLLSIDTEQVSAVTLEYPEEKKTFVLRKTAAGWRLQEPIEAAADETTVTNLVRAAADAELKRTLEDDLGPLETYGLEPPQAVVRLELADGTAVPAIRVGKSTPVGYSAFVQLEGETGVRLVGSAFATGMTKELKDLRDKQILAFETADVHRIRIDAAEDDDTELVREDDAWVFAGEEKLRADESEVRTFLSSLRGLRAQDFLDDAELAGLGLDEPRRRIVLELGEGEDAKRHELLVGSEDERDGTREIYVKRPDDDTVYTVATHAWSNLKKTGNAFRDKTVLVFDRERLGTVEVSRADGGTYRLVRRDAETTGKEETAGSGPEAETWIVEGAPESTRTTQTNQLVGDVHGLKGYEIAAENLEDLSEYGLLQPDVAFSFVDRDGEPIGRILVAQAGDGEDGRKSFAMAEGGNIVFRIRDYLYAHLDKKREDLVDPPPAPTPAPAAEEEKQEESESAD